MADGGRPELANTCPQRKEDTMSVIRDIKPQSNSTPDEKRKDGFYPQRKNSRFFWNPKAVTLNIAHLRCGL